MQMCFWPLNVTSQIGDTGPLFDAWINDLVAFQETRLATAVRETSIEDALQAKLFLSYQTKGMQ